MAAMAVVVCRTIDVENDDCGLALHSIVCRMFFIYFHFSASLEFRGDDEGVNDERSRNKK